MTYSTFGLRETSCLIPSSRRVIEGQPAFMTEVLPGAEVYVYKKDKNILAFTGLQGNRIAGLFVRDGHCSRGIGHEMTDFLRQAHETLTLCVYEKNERALKFYLKNGFSIVSKKNWMK